MTRETFGAILLLELKYITKAWRFWLALVPVVWVALIAVNYDAEQFTPYRYVRLQLFFMSLVAIAVSGGVSRGTNFGSFAISRPASKRVVLAGRIGAYAVGVVVAGLAVLLLAIGIDGAYDSQHISSDWREISRAVSLDADFAFKDVESERCFLAAEAASPGGAIACDEGLHADVVEIATDNRPLLSLEDRACLELWRHSTPVCEETLPDFDSVAVDQVRFTETEELLECASNRPRQTPRCHEVADMIRASYQHYVFYPGGAPAERCLGLLRWLRTRPKACSPSLRIEATADSLAPAWMVTLMMMGALFAVVCLTLTTEPKSSARFWMTIPGVAYLAWLVVPRGSLPFAIEPWMIVVSPFALAISFAAIGLVYCKNAELSTSAPDPNARRRTGWSLGFWLPLLIAAFAIAVGALIALLMTID
jgi:hypothetical protein